MERSNILNYRGLIKKEDYNKPISHGCHYFTFKSNINLSGGVDVEAYGITGIYSVEQYSQDLSSFMCWWNHFVMRDLNGFSGFSHVKFNLKGFTLR